MTTEKNRSQWDQVDWLVAFDELSASTATLEATLRSKGVTVPPRPAKTNDFIADYEALEAHTATVQTIARTFLHTHVAGKLAPGGTASGGKAKSMTVTQVCADLADGKLTKAEAVAMVKRITAESCSAKPAANDGKMLIYRPA